MVFNVKLQNFLVIHLISVRMHNVRVILVLILNVKNCLFLNAFKMGNAPVISRWGDRATIVAGSAGQEYVDNIFYNHNNDYELATLNRSGTIHFHSKNILLRIFKCKQ